MIQYKNLERNIYFLILAFPISLLVGVAFLNINSVLIALLFIFFIYKFNRIDLINDKSVYPFFLLLLFFFFSSIFSEYNYQSFENLFAFIVQILVFISLIFFLNKDTKFKFKLSKYVSLIIIIICIDLWIQSIFGKNILGFQQQQAGRLTSIFKDEQIPGGILFKLSPFYIYFLFKQTNEYVFKMKYIFILFLYFSILITGERLASILSTLALFLIPILNFKKIKLKYIFFYFILFLIIFILIYFQNDSIIRERISYTFLQFENNVYFKFFYNAFNIFKDNYWLGTGLQTYRYECALISQNCSTHPHNFLFELLSDAGLFATIIFYFSLFFVYIKKTKYNNSSFDKSIILTYTILLFFPFLPSGSFFNSFGMVIIWFSLGFIYSFSNDL